MKIIALQVVIKDTDKINTNIILLAENEI